MTPGELLEADKLTEAVAAAISAVKKKPTDTGARYLLSELLCLAGELERADRQLESISQQDAQATGRVSLVRQLIRAEQSRRQFFSHGRLPEFLVEASPLMRLVLDASIAMREGNGPEAAQLLEQAEQQRPRPSGTCDGQPFSDFRDLDDLTAGFFEVLTTTGKYYLIAVDSVRSLEFQPPERPLDLLWRQVRMDVAEGPDGDVYLPLIYVKTYEQDTADDSLRLGRTTDWLGDTTPVRGLGQRTVLVGEEAKGIGEIQQVQFNNG